MNAISDPWTKVPDLRGAHVRLRPLETGDGPQVLDAVRDGELWTLFYTLAPGPETIDQWVAAALADQAAGRTLPFVVEDRQGKVIGSTRFLRLNPRHRRAEIGHTFYSASSQRTPVNTECKLLLLGHAFEALGCECVQFRTDWFNHRSRRAIERLGAKQDGVLRNHTIMPDGRVRDTIVYSVIRNEWPGVRQQLQFLLGGAR